MVLNTAIELIEDIRDGKFIILMDDESMRISLPLIIGTALFSGGFFLWLIGRLVSLGRSEMGAAICPTAATS